MNKFELKINDLISKHDYLILIFIDKKDIIEEIGKEEYIKSVKNTLNEFIEDNDKTNLLYNKLVIPLTLYQEQINSIFLDLFDTSKPFIAIFKKQNIEILSFIDFNQ